MVEFDSVHAEKFWDQCVGAEDDYRLAHLVGQKFKGTILMAVSAIQKYQKCSENIVIVVHFNFYLNHTAHPL